MNLLSKLMFWKKNKIIINEAPTANSTKKSSGGQQITNANLKNFVVKAVGFSGDSSSGDFVSPDYDLSEIKTAAESDSYISIALRKYSELIFKAGYNIVSDNDAAAEYIESRLRMMSFTTNIPIDILFQQIAEDLIKYSNAFIAKSRVDTNQLGGIQAQGILDKKPVGGYFRLDPTTIQIKRDSNGTVQQYQQESGSDSATFKNTDMIHFYKNKEGGSAFGTPDIIPALEDVKLLRKIEGNVLDLIYRFAIPIYQMKVGIPEAGLMATDKEIDDAKTEIEKMASDGIIVTNERTDFKAIGAEGQAIDVSNYLSYFEKRVFSALNLSESQMGRGGAKQDADSMEEQVHQRVKFIQRTISIFIENFIFNELLLEGGFNPIYNEADIVKFQFNEINLDTKVKMETHAINQFQGNGISFPEMRKQLGLKSDNVDESLLYANMIQQKNALELVQAKLGVSSNSNSTSSNTGTSGPDKQQKTSGTAKNTISPTNQHGTTSVNIKESFSLTEESNTVKNIEKYKKNFAAIYKKYQDARNDICEHDVEINSILALTRDSISKDLKQRIQEEASNGVIKALNDINSSNKTISNKIIVKQLENKTDKILNNIFRDIKKRLKIAKLKEDKLFAFDAIEYRLRFLAEEIISKSYWFAYVKTCQQFNIPEVYVKFNNNKNNDDSEGRSCIVKTNAFTLDDIPPYNAYCSCKISTKGGYKSWH